MKILVVSSFLPYPLFSGGHVRLYNLMRELSKRHELMLICEKRSSQTEDDDVVVRKFCKELITVERKKQWTIGNILSTGISPFPFLMVGHTNSELKRRIKEALAKEPFDLIHIETFYVMQNVPRTNLPTVLASHNIEYLVYKRYVALAPLLLRPFLLLDVAKMRYWEEKFWKQATVLVAVSEHDRKIMGREKSFVVSNGVDLSKFKVQNAKFKVQKREKRILFIGDFKWVQNRDAVKWILREIWPKIYGRWKMLALRSGEDGKLTFWIVGKNVPDCLKKLRSEGVEFDENAPDDTPSIYQDAAILLAPIRVGGGSKFKILEAMASGVPVVTTPLGIEGISARDGKEALVGDSADTLASHIIRLLENEKMREQLSKNARKLIEQNYDWRKIATKLEEAYLVAIKRYQ